MGCGQCDQQYFGIWRDIFGSLESVLERLPTAKVMRKDQEGGGSYLGGSLRTGRSDVASDSGEYGGSTRTA